jgi:hypothetical protein
LYISDCGAKIWEAFGEISFISHTVKTSAYIRKKQTHPLVKEKDVT